MRYIMILVLLIVFAGCGGGNSSDNPPTSPQTENSENIPPQVPKI